jgi:hypothetical protein
VNRTLRRFRHPHLSYGIAYTVFGAFQVHRRIVEAPEEVGTRCGWPLLDDDDHPASPTAPVHPEGPTLSTRPH